MNEENKGFEEMFRKAFENAETEPSFVPWAKISEELKKEKEKKSIWLILRYTAACLVGFALLAGGIFFFSRYNQTPVVAVSDTKNQINHKNEVSSDKTGINSKSNTERRESVSADEKSIVSNTLPDIQKKPENLPNASTASLEKNNTDKTIIHSRINRQITEVNVVKDKKTEQLSVEKNNEVEHIVTTYLHKDDRNSLETIQNTDVSLLSAKYAFAEIAVKPKKTEIEINRYLSIEEPSVAKMKTPTRFSRWQADLTFGSGYFKPNIQTSTLPEANLTASNSILSLQNATTSFAQNYNKANSDFQDNSFPSLSYQTGLTLGYSISKRWSVKSGFQYRHESSVTKTVQYSQDPYGEKFPTLASIVSNQVTYSALFDNKNTFSNLPATYNSYIRLENEYRYLSIPVSVQYRFLDRKFGLAAGSGISFDFFMLNRISGKNDNVKEYNFTNSDNTIYKPLSFSSLLNLRADYRVFGKMSVFLEPYLKVALSSYTNSARVKSMPVNWGLGSGLQYRF